MEKSPEAFRTISEVADLLDTPAHVLRFWESRFPQIRPVKRAGGRRYYRPGDVALLAGIKKLLHDDGLTIRGVQKILREQGIRHVAGLVAPLPDPVPGMTATVEGEVVEDAQFLLSAIVHPSTPTETAQIIPLDQAFARHDALARPLVPTLTEADMVASDPEDVPEAPFIEAEEEPGTVERLPLFDHLRRPEPADQKSAGPAAEEQPTADQGAAESGAAIAASQGPIVEDPIAVESVAGPAPLGESSFAPERADDPETAADGPAPTTESQPKVHDKADSSDAPPAAPDPKPEVGDAAPSDAASAEAEHPTLAALLRRSRRARLAPHRRELELLRDRLADLRDRVAEASRRRIR